MVKKVEGEETKVSLESEPSPNGETEQESETPKTPTTEEQIATLQEKLTTVEGEREDFRAKFEEKEKGLKTAHSRLTEKEKELRKQADDTTWRTGIEERFEIMATLLDKRLASGELDDSEKAELRKEFAEIKKRQDADSKEAQNKAQQDEYTATAQAIYTKAQEAFKDDPISLSMVATNLDYGRTNLAEAMIAKAEKATDTKGDKVESEEERINKLVDEKLRQKMEEKGMLESETGGPSGGTIPDEKWLDEVYSTGKSDDHARADKIIKKIK